MGSVKKSDINSINLAVRFLLEIIALSVLGMWGWALGDEALKIVLMLAIPTMAAVIWGIFAVPDDSSRSGNAPIAVPGALRLVLEFAIFSLAAVALFAINQSVVAWLFIVIVITHYLVSYERVLWLLRQQ